MSVFDLWNPLMPTTSIRSIVWDNDGGGGSGGSSSRDSRPAKAKALDEPTFGSLAEASRAGYHGQTVNIEGKGLQNVSFGDKSYDAKMAAASSAANAANAANTTNTANTGGISSLINSIKNMPSNIVRDISMGLNLTDRDDSFYSRTADSLARQYGPERAQTYINEMRDKGNITNDLANSLMISTTITGEDAIERGLITDDVFITNPTYKQMLEQAGGVSSSNENGSGSGQTDGDDQTDGEEGDGGEEDTGSPSSMDFRFFGGYQPIARSDVLVPSSFQNRDIYFSNPRLDPIFPQRPPPPPIEMLDEVSGGFDYGDGGFTPGLISGPRMGDTGSDPNYRGDGTNFGMVMPATPGPQMPGQGQFSSMQELMEYQQQNPGMNLIGEYQRLRALEGGPPEPVVLPQRGVASLFNEQAPRYMYEGIMG